MDAGPPLLPSTDPLTVPAGRERAPGAAAAAAAGPASTRAADGGAPQQGAAAAGGDAGALLPAGRAMPPDPLAAGGPAPAAQAAERRAGGASSGAATQPSPLGDSGGGGGGSGSSEGGASYEARIRRFREDLRGPRVDLANLRRMAVHGIPDRDGLRAVAWKVPHRPASFAAFAGHHELSCAVAGWLGRAWAQELMGRSAEPWYTWWRARLHLVTPAGPCGCLRAGQHACSAQPAPARERMRAAWQHDGCGTCRAVAACTL